MNRVAVVFPGQGSQYAGMGRRLAESWPPAADLISEAGAILKRDLASLLFYGPKEELDDTASAQPAIFIVNLIFWKWLRSETTVMPEFAAGHSLGEYSALVAAGALDKWQALELVARRSELMKREALKHPGAMVAVLGLDSDAVAGCLAGSDGVQVANYNSPGQIVISGSIDGVALAKERLREAGAKKVVDLPVSGAFHSRLMAGAEAEFNKDLLGIEIKRARMPVISNLTAAPSVDPNELRQALAGQMTGAVRWEETIDRLTGDGVDVFIETGPGKVLKGLIGRIAPEAKVYSLDAYDNLEDFVVAVSEGKGKEGKGKGRLSP